MAIVHRNRALALDAPTTLEAWIAAFGGDDRKLRAGYKAAVETFLGVPEDRGSPGADYLGSLSPRTREGYGRALGEFFEWLRIEHRRVVPPHEVTRKDVESYVAWLGKRSYSVRERDLVTTPERLALYEAVKQLGSAKAADVAKALPASVRNAHTKDGAVDWTWLEAELGSLVRHDYLARRPTFAELRKDDPDLGIKTFTVVQNGQQLPLREVFRYSIPKLQPLARRTIAQRLDALSSFWDVLRQGENTAGGDAVLKYNVFDEVRRRLTRGIASEKRLAAERANQLTPGIVRKLLEAAEGGGSLVDKRDAAMLWFLVLTGARVSEAVNLRRAEPDSSDRNRYPGWLDEASEPPSVVLFRKGGKRQRLPYPPYALKALHAFEEELRRHAAPAGAQSDDPKARDYVAKSSLKWRTRELLEKPEAPLFPPIQLWGANAGSSYKEFVPNPLAITRGLSRHGVGKMLHRIAHRAGLDDDDVRKVHAHALRHFAANAMDEQGKPLRDIQAILGHTSITTTEGYLHDKADPVALSGQAEILAYISEAPIEPPSPSRRRVVEAQGHEVTEEVPEDDRIVELVEAPLRPNRKRGKKRVAGRRTRR